MKTRSRVMANLVFVSLLTGCIAPSNVVPTPTIVPASTPMLAIVPTENIPLAVTKSVTLTLENLTRLPSLSLPEFDAHYSTGDITLSADGNLMAVVSKDRLEGNKTVWVWSVNDLNRSLAGYQVILDDLWSVAFGLDGSQLAIGGNSRIIIVDWNTGKITDTIELPDSEAVQLAFGSNNTLIWSSFDHKVTVWDMSQKKIRYSVNGTVGFYPNSFALSPDGKLLVTGDVTSIHLWDFASGQEKEVREGPVGGIGIAPATVFSGKGTFLASTGCSEYVFEGCSSGKILIWKSDSEEPLVISDVIPTWINAVAFSPDEGTLASTSGEGTLKLINLDNGKITEAPLELAGQLPPHDTLIVSDINFLPNGNMLAISTNYGIQLLDVSSMFWMPHLRFILSLGYPYKITAEGDNLNFRKEPSKNGEIIKKLHAGDFFEIIDGPKIADDHVWWKVKIADNTQGWIVEQPGWYEFNP